VGLDYGGKRSATPLWVEVTLGLNKALLTGWESGVALRLPPQSILAGRGISATLSLAMPYFRCNFVALFLQLFQVCVV
jgi:hypothetical protein